MKKLLVLLILTTIASISFAKQIPGFFESTPSAEKIDEFIAIQKADKDVWRLSMGMAYKALVGKNAENTTYEEMKNIVSNAIKPHYKTIWDQNSVKYLTIWYLVTYNDNFKSYKNNFINEIINSTENMQSKLNIYMRYLAASNTDINSATKIKALRALINHDILPSLSAVRVKSIVDIYAKLRINIAPADQIKDLQRIKMIFYPKISTSEDWKNLMVQVELMIKAIQ